MATRVSTEEYNKRSNKYRKQLENWGKNSLEA